MSGVLGLSVIELMGAVTMAAVVVHAVFAATRRSFSSYGTRLGRLACGALCLVPLSVVILALALVLPAGGGASATETALGEFVACIGTLAGIGWAIEERRRRQSFGYRSTPE